MLLDLGAARKLQNGCCQLQAAGCRRGCLYEAALQVRYEVMSCQGSCSAAAGRWVQPARRCAASQLCVPGNLWRIARSALLAFMVCQQQAACRQCLK